MILKIKIKIAANGNANAKAGLFTAYGRCWGWAGAGTFSVRVVINVDLFMVLRVIMF